MIEFPAWGKPEEDAPPVLFNVGPLPEGWLHVPGHYDFQRGVWIDPDPLDHDGDGAKGGSLPGKKATARKRK